ncbi:MAG: HPr family phosphocarrier protein [Planctomycetales bacterium]
MNSIPVCMRDVTVGLEHGLHLTPSSQIVQTAQRFQAKISIRKGELVVDGKSMLDLLSLAAAHGEVLRLETQGADAPQALQALVALFEQNFASEPPPTETR